MKKKAIMVSILPVLFLFILMPNAFSIYEEHVYSETVEDGDVVNISGSIFEFKMDSRNNKVLVEIDVSGVIIEDGECKIKDNFDICVGNISFSYKNLTTYYEVYKALVDVYQIKSKIDITHTIEKNNILIDEETIATLTFENIADIAAENVTAIINIPSSVLVTEVDGCKKTSDSIVFKDNVHPRQIRSCAYKIMGLNASDFELKANITYFDGIEKISAASTTIKGKVYNHSLEISPQLNKSKFNIGEKLSLTMNIKNINDQYDLIVTALGIKPPERLSLIKRPKGTTYSNGVIHWSGTLAPKEDKNITIELQGFRSGNFSVLTEASYKISKFLRAAKEISNVEVYCDCPYITSEFSQGIAVPGQRIGLKAFVINPNLVDTFKNVKIDYVTSIPNIQDFSTAYSEIGSLGSIKIFDSSFITPPLDETYHFNITITYESINNEIFVGRDSIIIKIPKALSKDEEEIKVTGEEESKKEETEEEQQEEVEESIETGKKEETIGETEKKETKEETPATTIKSERRPFNAYVIIAFITASIFLLFLTIAFRRKKREEIEEAEKKGPKEEKEVKEKQEAKEFLLTISKKREAVEKEAEYHKREEEEYNYLEKEIRKLGNVFEEKKVEKTGFFGRFFKGK